LTGKKGRSLRARVRDDDKKILEAAHREFNGYWWRDESIWYD
jgi:hypothetical protein